VLCRLALAGMTLVVSVDEATQTSAVTANHDDDLANPALDVLDVATAHAAKRIDNVDEIGAEVPQHVDEAAWLAEWHDHGGVFDEAQSSCVQCVPKDVVGAACRQGWGVDGALFGVWVN
jgi:hypothetical protein